MDFYTSYLAGVNQTIGENGRFVRQFNANRQASTGTSTTTSQSASNTQSQNNNPLSPLLLMLLYQLLGQIGGDGSGTSAANNSNSALQAYKPYVPNLTPNDANLQGSPLGGQPYNNPALTSLESRFAEKAAQNDPESPDSIDFSPEDVEAVRTDLKNGRFTEAELGQALKYELDQAPDKNLPVISQLITNLTDSGDLNPVPFLQNDYLSRLQPDRQDALLSSLEVSGLRLNTNKPNSRLIGFMLDTLAKPDSSASKLWVQRFLQDFHDVYGNQPDTPVGKILSQTLDLAGVSADAKGLLIYN